MKRKNGEVQVWRREKWNTPGSGGESVPGTENDAVQPSENSGKGNEKHEIPGGEAGVDYSRAAGVREEIRRPQGASAWNTGGTTLPDLSTAEQIRKTDIRDRVCRKKRLNFPGQCWSK